LQVGHAGTLDPMATGLLIVCVGKATKQLQRYMFTYSFVKMAIVSSIQTTLIIQFMWEHLSSERA
jgi:tRNA pseudouridine55 synthase